MSSHSPLHLSVGLLLLVLRLGTVNCLASAFAPVSRVTCHNMAPRASDRHCSLLELQCLLGQAHAGGLSADRLTRNSFGGRFDTALRGASTANNDGIKQRLTINKWVSPTEPNI